MAEVAALLSDSVVPAVRMRQWVSSVPKRQRPHLMRDSDLASAVLRILLRVIRSELRGAIRGCISSDARLGAVSSRVPLHSPDARLIYELPRPAHDGRTVIRLSPLELLDRVYA